MSDTISLLKQPFRNLVVAPLALLGAFSLGTMYDAHVRAQSQTSQPAVENITPNLTVGSLGTNTVLAHEVYTDHLVVNGVDILQLNQQIVNYLASRPNAEAPDIQRIIVNSREKKLYKLVIPGSVVNPPAPQAKPSVVPEGRK